MMVNLDNTKIFFKAQRLRPSGEHSDEHDMNVVEEAFSQDRWKNLDGILVHEDLSGSPWPGGRHWL